MRRVLQAADIAGVRAMVVHAKDETARRFLRPSRLRGVPRQAADALPAREGYAGYERDAVTLQVSWKGQK
jgi:hypothetical protein